MLTCRVPAPEAPDGADRQALARTLARHPLGSELTATITIGVAGASPWRADDSGPRVVVLLGHGNLTRVQRAHLALADGIVVTDPSIARAAAASAPGALVAIAAGEGRVFLRGATPREADEAWSEVGGHRALAHAIGGGGRADAHGQTAELVLELIVALGN